MPETVTVPCEECGIALGPDSDFRFEPTEDGDAYVYWAECWEREFGENGQASVGLATAMKPSGRLVTEPPVPQPNEVVSRPLGMRNSGQRGRPDRRISAVRDGQRGSWFASSGCGA